MTSSIVCSASEVNPIYEIRHVILFYLVRVHSSFIRFHIFVHFSAILLHYLKKNKKTSFFLQKVKTSEIINFCCWIFSRRSERVLRLNEKKYLIDILFWSFFLHSLRPAFKQNVDQSLGRKKKRKWDSANIRKLNDIFNAGHSEKIILMILI